MKYLKSILKAGATLGFVFLTGSVLAASSIYVGNSTNQTWSLATNWQANAVPAAGDDLVIADTTAANSLTMNDGVHTIGTLQFGTTGTRANPTQPQFIINGNVTGSSAYALTITNGVIANGNFNVSGTAGFQTKLPIVVQGDQTWSVGGNAGSSTADFGLMLTVGANGTQRPLTLNGKLIKTGPGQLCFIGQNVGGGADIIVSQGSLKYNAGSSTVLTVGGTGTVIVSNGASLFISKNSGNLNITKPVFLNDGAGLRFGGNSAGLNSVGCPITFNGTVPIALEYASLNLNSTSSWSGTINSTITGTGGTNTFWVANPLTGTINNNAAFRMRFGVAEAASPSVAYGLNNANAIYDISGPVTRIEFGALGGSAGTVLNGNTNSAPVTLTVGRLNTSTTFGGVLIDGNAALSLVKVGTGTFTLSGANTYSGSTTVSNGTLLVSGATATLGSGPVSVRSGAVLGGAGIALGTAVGTATLDNGASLRLDGGIGAPPLTFNSLTLGNSGADITTSSIDVNFNGKAAVFAALTVNGTHIINLVGGVPSVGVYDLISHPGVIGGAGFSGFSLGPLPPGVTGQLQNSGTAIQLNITAVTIESSIWTGAAQSLWDVKGTLDWKGAGSGTQQVYTDRFPALFDDSATSFFVNVVTNVYPAIVTVDNTTHTYTFTNTSGIQGSAALTKSGSGTLIVANENGYIGGTYITNGILQIGLGGTNGSISGFVTNGGNLAFNRSDSIAFTGNIVGTGTVEQKGTGRLLLTGGAYSGASLVTAGTLAAGGASALGDTNGATTVAAGATLDVNSQNLGAEPISVSGSGIDGAGAIVNNGPGDQQNATRYVTLTGDTVFGGARRWDVRDPSPSINTSPNGGVGAILTGNGNNLTKVSSNTIAFINTGETGLGDIDIKGGILTFSRSTFMGNASRRVTVWPGAALQFHRTSEYIDNVMNKVASFTNASFNLEGSGLTNKFAGPVTLTGTSNFMNLPSATGLILQGAVNGAGSNTIVGPGTLTIAGNANYTGGTTVNGATLIVNGTLGTGVYPLQVLGASTIAGNGTIKDAVTIPSGSLLSPGEGYIGQLTINKELILAAGSSSRFEVYKEIGTNDNVVGLSKVTYGGTLIMTNAGFMAYAPSDVFKLFNAGSYTGSFSSIVPSIPAAGLVWYTNNLPVNGTIEVRILPNPQPPIVCSVSSLFSNTLNVIFSLEVEDATANDPLNYSFVTPNMPRIVSAQKIYAGSGNFTISPTNVLLTLDGPITTTPYTLHVQNVRNTSYVPDTVVPTNVVGYALGFQLAYAVQVTNGAAFAYATNIKVFADGDDIFNMSDWFEFVGNSVSGDFDVSVNLNSFPYAGNDAGKAGIMARESLSVPPLNSERMVMMASFPEPTGRNQNFFEYRDDPATNAIAPGSPRPAATYPNNWLRLKRTGNIFRGLCSSNNLDWTLVGTVDVSTNSLGPSTPYADPILLGLAACSHSRPQTAETTWSNWGTPGERPTLVITNSLGSVGLTWPNWIVGKYTLQATPSLAPTITWTNVPGTLNLNTISLPAGANNLYFRLAPQ